MVATPEALVEFENLKVLLNSPPVLKQFQYNCPTFVYTDASIGTSELPGGLGVVIVQSVDECDYVCAYASAGLTPAQKNYHIVRLELLAFVFACGKFYDWLAGISFIWRSDCRAHEFLHSAKTFTNPTIAHYAWTLAEFDFRVEWVPGLTMIADCFSRLVITPCGAISEALSLPEVVFGVELRKRIKADQLTRGVAEGTPLLLFDSVTTMVVVAPCVVEIEDEIDGWQLIGVTDSVDTPSLYGHQGIADYYCSKVAPWQER